uniref:autotransporter outer membrane beta-barrel domain-containing protein n=1 Tax=uncultured Erythrobacter sp. TaxID=263913 RepID=UPI002617028A|nr:autotransporter domain-containing protein [uncultured Erythrobacter sp.]
MTISASNKLRTIGGASVIALSAGFAVPALAQSAPAPLAAAPAAPTTPAQPGTTVQCAELQTDIFTCLPGTDPDGVGEDPFANDPADPIRVIVREDAFVTGSTGFASGASVTGDIGTIVTNFGSIVGGANGAVILNNDSILNNVGFISSDFAVGVRTLENVLIRNSGTIYGNSTAALISGFHGTAIINQGLIQNDAGRTIFVGGDVDPSTVTTITNEETGSIFGTADNANVIEVNDNMVLENAGLIQAFGANSSAIASGNEFDLINTGNIVNESGATIVANALADLRNNAGGLIEARDGSAISLTTSGSRVINTGTIIANGLGAVNAGSTTDISVINNGVMTAATQTIRAGDNLLVVNRGTLSADGGFAIATTANFELRNLGSITADGNAVRATDNAVIQNTGGSITSASNRGLLLAGTSTVTNDGSSSISGTVGVDALAAIDMTNAGVITSTDGDAISGEDDVTLNNSGTVTANGGDAVELNNGTITNSGSLVSASSAAGERSAGVRFDVSAVDSTVTNEAGGLISGEIGIFVDNANTAAQTVANFGTITGGIGEAIVLGSGADEFQQWTGAVVNGNVRLGDDDDTFILEGTMSSITGSVLAGNGNDTAILGGTLDADNLDSFETISLGQLFDLTVSGARTLTGATSVDGNVTFGLGVDSLAVDGDVDLAGGNITVQTPLDAALLGQTLSLITATGTLSDSGTTFTIIDDDLLVDYTRIAGTADIQVTGVDPLIGSGDRNVVAIGNALFNGISANTLSAANFAALNGLADANALEDALLDALPSLSDGVGREIFETSSAASDALDRHLAQEESSIWGQIIVRGADQDALSQSAAGYDADETIFTLGGDFALGDSIVIGALASYADIEINDTTTGTSSVQSEVESVKVGLYTGIQLFDRGFFNAEVSYLTGSVDTASSGFFGPIVSNYDFDGIAGRATLGYDLIEDENVWLTPSIGVNLANINFDDTVETGGFGFNVERGDAEYFELRAGVELGSQISEKVTGFVKGTVIHDTVDTVRSFRLSSAQLPTFFAELPVRSQDRFELAVGLDAELADNVSVGVGYLGDYGDGYTGHAGRATLRIGF